MTTNDILLGLPQLNLCPNKYKETNTFVLTTKSKFFLGQTGEGVGTLGSVPPTTWGEGGVNRICRSKLTLINN